MIRYSIAALALVSLLAAAPAAKADDFNFTFTSEATTDGTPNIYATGTLTGTEVGSTGVWDITSGTIDLTSNFLAVTGSGTVSADSWDGNDNQLTPGATGLTPYIDNGGMLFTIDGTFVELYSIPLAEFAGPGTFSYGIVEEGVDVPAVGIGDAPLSSGPLYDTTDEFALTSGTPTVTPEPPSILLLASGLLALAFFAFRKPRQATVALNF
jgi:hypothetical protein